MPSTLETNLAAVRDRLERACLEAGRDPAEVQLLPVTKSVSVQVAADLPALGERELAESRVQELARKAEFCTAAGVRVRWHLIGHLQRNKVRLAVQVARVIHSIDSLRLLDTLESQARGAEKRLGIYLQVRFDERHGFEPAEVPEALAAAVASDSLDLLGLMALGPRPVAGARPAREVFEDLARLSATLPEGSFHDGHARLSMGMSSDLEAAVQAGSTCCRIGSDLFRDLAPPSAANGSSRP